MAVVATTVLASGLSGCASVSQVIAPGPPIENPLIVPTEDFETVWRKVVAVIDVPFDIRFENRVSRTIVTDPVMGATLLEPWRSDTVTLTDRFESTLQTMRRFARVQIDPVPGRGYAIKLEVYKELEDLAKPDRQSAGRAVFNNDFPVNRTREIIGPVPVPLQWIPRGRDSHLERVLLNRIKDKLIL
jgi:uncharacterized protein YceK